MGQIYETSSSDNDDKLKEYRRQYYKDYYRRKTMNNDTPRKYTQTDGNPKDKKKIYSKRYREANQQKEADRVRIWKNMKRIGDITYRKYKNSNGPWYKINGNRYEYDELRNGLPYRFTIQKDGYIEFENRDYKRIGGYNLIDTQESMEKIKNFLKGLYHTQKKEDFCGCAYMFNDGNAPWNGKDNMKDYIKLFNDIRKLSTGDFERREEEDHIDCPIKKFDFINV